METTAFVRKYGVALLMVAVACHQFYRVQVESLCSWRGGGFGMYASFHPRHHDLWVTRTDTGESIRFEKYDKSSGDAAFEAARWCLTWPHDDQVAKAVERLPDDLSDVTQIDVYRLTFDPQTGELGRVLLASSRDEAQEP